MGSYISIITLNINGLNAPTKRQRLAEWTQKQNPYTCCLQETHLKTRDTYRRKVKGWKKIFHANRNQNKTGIALLISEKKTDFMLKSVTRDKEGNDNGQWINSRRYNNYKYIHIQHRSTKIFKTNTNSCKQKT